MNIYPATHLYNKMSAACRTGYVNNPVFSNDSSTSDSSFAFRDVARRAFHVVILRSLPTGVMQLNTQLNSVWCGFYARMSSINNEGRVAVTCLILMEYSGPLGIKAYGQERS